MIFAREITSGSLVGLGWVGMLPGDSGGAHPGGDDTVDPTGLGPGLTPRPFQPRWHSHGLRLSLQIQNTILAADILVP